MDGDFRRSGIRGVLVMALVIGSATVAFSQVSLGGRLRGVISDPSAAVIAKAQVRLVNHDTGAQREFTTGNDGAYEFNEVHPATYRLTVTAPGFRTSTFENVTINLNEVRALNITMQVGAVSDVISVTGEAVSVVPHETTLRGLIDENKIKELPLNNRDFQTLVYSSPGITRSPTGSSGQGSGFATSGARATVNNFLVDGADVNDATVPFGVGLSIVTGAIPIDALEEFTVITSNATPEFGRSSGATVNVLTKTGSNTFHGSGYEFLRSDKLNSRNFFDPVSFKSPLHQHQFGGQVGGYIFKDKLFFSAAYDRFQAHSSSSLQFNGPTTTLVNSITNPYLKALMSTGYPTFVGSGTGSATEQGTADNSSYQHSAWLRMDYRKSEKHAFFATMNITDYLVPNTGTGPPDTGTGEAGRGYISTVQHTWTISPNKLNIARFTYSRIPFLFTQEEPTAAMLSAGMLRTAGPFAGQPFTLDQGSPNGFPTLAFLSGQFTTAGLTSNFPQSRVTNTFSISDSFSWTHGRHNVKFGGEYKKIQENSDFAAAARPSITIDDSTLASLRAGSVFSETLRYFNTGSKKYFRYNEMGFFIQDSFRIRPRLTLELGMRYELTIPFHEAGSNITNLYVMDSNGKPKACAPIPIGAGLANTAVLNPSQFGIRMYCMDKNNFAPRLGLSWDVFGNGKTVLRSAYGIFYDRAFGNVFGNSRFSPPLVVPTTIGGFNLDGTVGVNAITPTQVFTLTTIDPSIRTPYTQRWNLTVSRELDRNSVLSVGYVGSKGTKLLQTLEPNFGTGFSSGTAGQEFRPSNQGAPVRTAADIAAGIIRPPFGIISHRETGAASSYNAMEVQLSHRLSHGLSFDFSYTYGHSLDSVSDDIAGSADSAAPPATSNNLLAPLMIPGTTCAAANGTPTTSRLTAAVRCAEGNPGLTTNQAAALFASKYMNLAQWNQQNWGDSVFDVRHRFVASLLYDLPIGSGKWLAGNAHGVVDQVIGGWSIRTNFDRQSGTPVPLFAGVDANRDGDSNDRAVATGDLSVLGPNVQKNFLASGPVVEYFNCVAINQTTGAGTNNCPVSTGLGILDARQRIGRGRFRQPGYYNQDLQLSKTFKLNERFRLQFRNEFFNIWNVINLRGSGTGYQTVSSSSFGNLTRQRFIGNTQSRNIQFGLRLEF